MNTPISLTTPLTKDALASLKAGDKVLLSGTVYTARDAAHKRMFQALNEPDNLDKSENTPPAAALPFPVEGAVIFYVGPTPAPEGRAIGSAGPTTAYRMDAYTPRLHELGLAATIGKGKRGQEVRDALKKHQGVYFGATGGAAALLSRHITQAEVIAYDDLGTEAIRKLTFQDFPLLVVYDAVGGSIFE